MWHGRKQTLPSNRRASTLVKKPRVKQPSLYKRFSLRNPEQFEDEILQSGLGLHPDFMIPTTPRGLGGKMVKLDALRLLNMGHINERYHQDYFHPPKRSSVLQELELEARLEEPIFPVREILKVARNSLQPVKIKLDRTPDPMRRSASAIASKSEFDSLAIKGGFFTVEQGIGTGRVNSPTYQRKWYWEAADLHEDPIYNLSLVKQSGIKSTDGQEMPEPDSVFSPVGKRLNKRAQNATIWSDAINPKTNEPLKYAPFKGVAAAQQKVHMELVFGPKPPGEKVWPMNQFLRMAPPKELRTVERITPNQQKLDLQKGLGIGAKTQMLDFGTKAESLRRQLDPSKWKEEGRNYLCKGVLHDNAQEYNESVAMYKKYLEICERLDDVEGQALAHNFIGCAIQEKENLKLELVKSESGKNPVPESSVVEYERALYHHKKAAEKSGIEGRFICYTNLGLLCSTLSMWAKAAKNHKKALKCATVLENPRGQCAAVGNLGFLLYKRKKYEAAKACMIRYLQICRVINFMPGIARAHFYLGDIEAQFKRYKAALVEFEDSFAAAKECNDRTIQTLCTVQIGVCKGTLQLRELADSVEAQSMFETAEDELFNL